MMEEAIKYFNLAWFFWGISCGIAIMWLIDLSAKWLFRATRKLNYDK